ncbi:MAG: hypothetical protein ABI678_19900 [Kofleriaceae bacterium]
MRSILFSLTLVFFTGCLTEAATPTDDLDDVGAVVADPGDPDLVPSDEVDPQENELSEADRAMRLELAQDTAAWQIAHDNMGRPDYTPPEPDCTHVAGKPLDPRCKHQQP